VRVPRVVIVYPVPMPYTFPVLRLIATSGEIELSVLYSKRSLAGRGGEAPVGELGFPHLFLRDLGRVTVGRTVREIDVNPGLPLALERHSADLVVLSGFVQPTSLLGIAWARLRRRPYGLFVESHDLRRRSRRKNALRRALVGPLVRGAAVLYPTGESAKQSLTGLGGSPARMVAFPHVPDPAVFHAGERELARTQLREQFGLSPETPVLVFVGRLVASKGVESLLRAHASVHEQTGALLVIVGDGPLRGSLEAAASSGVTFLGFRPPAEIAGILRGADLALSPSLDEPWGTFPLEAAACGCPIVATDRVASARELVGSYGAGRLVTAGAPEELATTVIEVLADPAELERFHRQAILAAANFTPERAARGFLDGVRMTFAAKGTS
jgi:glycosyltransferase involved in cell wall biosynthesis